MRTVHYDEHELLSYHRGRDVHGLALILARRVREPIAFHGEMVRDDERPTRRSRLTRCISVVVWGGDASTYDLLVVLAFEN